MNLINLIFLINLFVFVLTISTVSRRSLTYKGLVIVLLILNFLLLCYCITYWNNYVISQATESFSYKLNVNNWNNIPMEINLKINSLNFLFLFLVLIIGFSTNLYILTYFKYEERCEEFILLINWFIFSMIFLVISNNFFTLILGWELIGLTSFLLINFWKLKLTTLGCSFKAYAFNKVSDLFLIVGCVLLWNAYKISDIDTLLTYISMNKVNTFTLYWSSVCFFISACIKSAQIIGHLWLPDSMEAPVPASALIHSATLVSAGIYLILKFQTLFIISQLLNVIFFIGSLTACYGGVVAAFQTDMKKMLAYSTISHCGFIMASIGLNNFLITIIYLYLHGLFKAGTFFCAGSIIKLNNTQDMRYMGMSSIYAYTTTSLIISAVNLGGLPFTFGYLSKEVFLNLLSVSHFSRLSYGLCLIGLLSSVVYVFKLIYYSSFDFRKGHLNTNKLISQQFLLNNTKIDIDSSFSQRSSFTVIFVFSIFFFIIIKLYMFKIYPFYNYIPEVVISDYTFYQKYFALKKHIISIYYVFFSFLILAMFLNTNRSRFSYHNDFDLMVNLWGIFSFTYVISGILKYLNKFLFFLLIVWFRW